MKLVIDRTLWIRGEPASHSYLLRPNDGKSCCLGFLGCAIGINRDTLWGERMPIPGKDWEPTNWLFAADSQDRLAVHRLTEINDEHSLDDREEKLKREFAAHDIEVEFIN
jgi:hypothetical protein